MELFEKLTAEEKNAIQNYIEYYAGVDAEGTTMNASLDYILRFWDKNKKTLFDLMGKKLIISKDISYNAPTEVLEDEIFRMIRNEGSSFRQSYLRMINEVFAYDMWDSRTAQNEHSYYAASSLMEDYEGLAHNIFRGEAFTVPGLHGHDVIVKPGCKISKVLGKIAAARDLTGYEDFRVGHSMCLNQKKLTGQLCISIHPLDYMTMSDNLCDWESCMSWQNCGSYRQGTVEMMNSAYVVIAYLESTRERMSMWEGFDWSNKKWRQLFVVTPDIIMGIKPYPYDCPECEGMVLKTLRDLAEKNMGWGPYNKNMSSISNMRRNTFADIGKNTEINFVMNHMYNDITSGHNAYVSIQIPDRVSLNLSGETECMTCGANYTDDRDEVDTEMLSCPECVHMHRCDACGEYYDLDDLTWVDGRPFCPYCFENYTYTCALTGEPHIEENLIDVYLRVNNEITGYNVKISDEALNSQEFTQTFGNLEKAQRRPSYSSWTYDEFVVDAETMPERGWEIFFSYSDSSLEDLKEQIFNMHS